MSQEEIKEIIKEGTPPEKVNEELVARHLYTNGQPDPDLIIRTGGEVRISNFLIWQAAYSELYFPQKYWPDFTERDLDEALNYFASHQRRLGK